MNDCWSIGRYGYLLFHSRAATCHDFGTGAYKHQCLRARFQPGRGCATSARSESLRGLFKDNAVGVLDTSTDQVLSTIAVPAGPHGIVITPDGRWVYISSDGASTVSVIDTSRDTISNSIEVGQTPHALAITPDGSMVLVAGFGTDQVSAINTATDQVVWNVGVASPHNIAITQDGKVACVASQARTRRRWRCST